MCRSRRHIRGNMSSKRENDDMTGRRPPDGLRRLLAVGRRWNDLPAEQDSVWPPGAGLRALASLAGNVAQSSIHVLLRQKGVRLL